MINGTFLIIHLMEKCSSMFFCKLYIWGLLIVDSSTGEPIWYVIISHNSISNLMHSLIIDLSIDWTTSFITDQILIPANFTIKKMDGGAVSDIILRL